MLIDKPDDRDWQFEVLFWETTDHKPIPFPLITIQNQWAQDITRMACGQYGLVHIINAQDRIANAINKTPKFAIQAIDCWRDILLWNPNAEFVGSTLQSNLEWHRKKGNITGYATLETKEQCMQAIDMNCYIYTWSQTGDWEYVRDKHEYRLRTDGKIVGHITCYWKYDKDYVWGINSYWIWNGLFKVPWDIFLNHYFTKYAVLDTSVTDAVAKYRAR